jgi:hypothetical protein
MPFEDVNPGAKAEGRDVGDELMSFLTVITLFAACIVLLICVLLALHKDYHSGLAGTVGLGFLGIAAFARITAILTQSGPVVITPLAMMFWIGSALFLGQITVNFLMRSRKRGPNWYEAESPKRESFKKAA